MSYTVLMVYLAPAKSHEPPQRRSTLFGCRPPRHKRLLDVVHAHVKVTPKTRGLIMQLARPAEFPLALSSRWRYAGESGRKPFSSHGLSMGAFLRGLKFRKDDSSIHCLGHLLPKIMIVKTLLGTAGDDFMCMSTCICIEYRDPQLRREFKRHFRFNIRLPRLDG